MEEGNISWRGRSLVRRVVGPKGRWSEKGCWSENVQGSLVRKIIKGNNQLFYTQTDIMIRELIKIVHAFLYKKHDYKKHWAIFSKTVRNI